MLQNSMQITKKTLSNQSVKSMLEVLKQNVAVNSSLADDLKTFLETHNISIGQNGNSESFNPSFQRRAGDQNLLNLKSSFERLAVQGESVL